MDRKQFSDRLKQRLLIEFQKQDRSGVYGYTQRNMAYNSNRIEGSTLTEKQTASMFETGTIYSDESDFVFRAKDIEEMNGHFKMFNYMLKHLSEPLSVDIIKGMHRNLKEGVFEDMANGYAVGDWKKRANIVGNITTALPQEVPVLMHNLIHDYAAKKSISLENIAKFHADFEKIHPFQDGNGRVGRMIILKQCLNADIIPVIIQDIHKSEYYRCLDKAHTKQDYSSLVSFFEKEQQIYQQNVMSLIFDFDEIN